jgi:tricorn protease
MRRSTTARTRCWSARSASLEPTLGRDGADRRAVVAAVREAFGGRLGYLNIPGTNAPGWAEFHRDLYTESLRDGLIVDFRDAQGGNTSQLLVEKLARRIMAGACPGTRNR